MKTSTVMMGWMMFGAALMTSCNKDKYSATSTTLANQSTQTKMTEHYVTFNSGFVMTSYAKVTSNSNKLAESSTVQKMDLFVPLSLSGLPQMSAGTYENLAVTMKAFTNSGSPSLYLKGSWLKNNGAIVPVSFMILPVVRLDAFSGIQNVTDQDNLLSLMNIDPNKLTANISLDMWEKAANETKDISNGEIIISEQYNSDLYKIMLDNLSSMVRVSFPSQTDDAQVVQSDK